MRDRTRLIVCMIVVFGILSVASIPAKAIEFDGVFTEEELREMLIERVSHLYKDWEEKDQTERMAEINRIVQERDAHLASNWVAPFEWRNTLNFSNSGDYFGEWVMSEAEVESNLQNYYFQLLYGDIEAACETSILDLLLFRTLDGLIVDWLDVEFSGFCNGMAQAVRAYFMDPAQIPLGKDYAYELPPPHWNETISEARNGDVTESAIKEWVLWKGSAAFFNPNHLLRWVKIYLGLTTSMGGSTPAEEYLKMTEYMMKGSPHYEPVTLLLMNPCWVEAEPTNSHFVTAYDYTVNPNGSVTIYIYNNWDIYNSTWGMYDDWILLKADGTFEDTHLIDIGHYDDDHHFTSMAAYAPTSEYNSILTALMDLLDDILSLGIFSPVDVEVTDPLGRTISINENEERVMEFPAITMAKWGHKDVMMPYVPTVPYQINLKGTDTGDYRMEMNRIVDGEVVTHNVTGTTEQGEEDIYTVKVGEAGGMELSKQGVVLDSPEILSGSSVELNWSRYNEPDFEHYEILQSRTLGEPGEVVATIDDIETTDAIISGLESKESYFFTVRVNTTTGIHADSNQVGAVMPEDISLLLYAAVGGAALVVLIVIALICRRRRK